MSSLPTSSIEFDQNLNRLDSLLQGLGVQPQTRAGDIVGGVFGATNSTNGIEFGVDKSSGETFIQSRNFATGSAGWQIKNDGTAEFVSITASGYIAVGGAAADVNAGVTTISGGKITTNSLAADRIITGQLVVGTNVGLGTAQDSAGVTTIIGNTVTTGYVNALSVVAGSVAAENITGTTITGKTVQTAASGARVVMGGGAEWIKFYDATVLCGTFYGSGGSMLIQAGQTNKNVVIGGGTASGHVSLADSGNVKLVTSSTGITISGNIVLDGTVDGVDVAAHAHSGSGQGGTVAHSSIGSVSSDQHHARSHNHSSSSDGTALQPASLTTSGTIETSGSLNGGYLTTLYRSVLGERIQLWSNNGYPLSNLVEGQMYYHSGEDDVRVRRDTSWADLCWYDERNAASPLPTTENAIEKLKEIKGPTVSEDGLSFNTEDFPKEFHITTSNKTLHTNLLPVIGLLIKSQKEILTKVEQLENKIT